MEPEVSEPSANGTRPAATALPDPLDEPPDQRVRVPGIQSGTEHGCRREAVTAAARQLHHGQFADKHGARLVELLEHGCGVVEYLRGVRARAPGGRMAGEPKQILRAEGNALQRAAVTLALEFLIHLLCAADGDLGERQEPGRCSEGRAVPGAGRRRAPVRPP